MGFFLPFFLFLMVVLLIGRPDAEMENSLEKDIEYFFVVWIVMFLWFVLTRSSCLEDTTQHLWYTSN